MDIVDKAIAIFFIIVAGIAGTFVGVNLAQSGERQEAVNAGAARYEVNPQTGQTRFVYLKPGSQ